MNKGLIALACGTFALGIAEFTMMGVLGDVSAGLDISVSKAGHLISAYALGVCAGAPSLLWLRGFPLRRLLLLLVSFIVLGNALAALSQGFVMLLCARFISGLPHGAYFGAAAIVAQKLVPPGKGASAVAAMIAGMTVANLLGVPAATFISNLISWRYAFAIVAVSGLLTWILVSAWVPRLAPLAATNFKAQFRFLKDRAPWLIFLGTFFGQGSVYCWFSYVEPAMTGITGFSPASMTWVMMLAGLGMVLGNYVNGRLSDRYKAGKVAALTAASIIVILPLIFFCAHWKAASLLLMFLATAALFGIGGPLQYLIVRFAKGGEMLGGACIQIAFNVSNAIASFLGGTAIHLGFGLESPALVGIPLAVTATVILFSFTRRYNA